eukprot:9383048-Alexandrium_andersonii.AAC.1
MEGVPTGESAPTGLSTVAEAEGTGGAIRSGIRWVRKVGGCGNPSGGFIRSARPGRDKVDATVAGQRFITLTDHHRRPHRDRKTDPQIATQLAPKD